jgi:transcriptional regulator with XRE-family HTH domain
VENSAAMRRRLRVELRRLRSEADMTQREVASALEWSPSKVIRIESGQVGISVTDLRALAGLYGVTAGPRLDALAELARGGKRQPFAEYRDVLAPETIRYFGYEASASLIRSFQPLVVPGLLQTEDYTRAMLESFGVDGNAIDRVVESRRERQEVLENDEPPELFVVLDESVLRRGVGGPTVMKHQLEHLLRLDARPRVTIQVVPFSNGAYSGIQGPFTHLEFGDPMDPDVVFIDNDRTGVVFLDDPEVTGRYQEEFLLLEDLASRPGELGRFVDRTTDSVDAISP